MTNRRSPCLTSWPSLKWTVSMNPETRARTSTCSTATKRPVYSSHSVIVFCSGCATVTGGAGGAQETYAGHGIALQLIGSACELALDALRSSPFDAEHWRG